VRSRIYELWSLGWSYTKICNQYPEIPYSIIVSIYRKEAERVNNISKLRCRALRVITEEERDSLLETILLTPEIFYEAL
jgi:hypothetical protein